MSNWTKEVQDALAAPFPEDEIEFLPRATSNGRALALAHIDARSVMRRLDAAVGPDGWSFDFDMLSPDGKKVRGKLTVLGVTKCDAGEANSEDEPLKAAVSDALKRCGVHFGIGRYLYYLPQLWVNFDEQRRRFAETPRHSAAAIDHALAICGYQGDKPAAAAAAAAPAARDRRPAARAAAPVQLKVAEGGREDATPATVPAAPAMSCANEECGKPLTRGQHDISMRAFGRPLCPACQRQQARVA